MYARIGGTLATGGVLATTGTSVPFAADFIAVAALMAAGLLLLRSAYLARSRDPRHAGEGAGRSARTAADTLPVPAAQAGRLSQAARRGRRAGRAKR
ncbi:hypothetical protein GCM10022288_12660 [Gryllotalpicola kribbensis]|jgi:hypothetical protein|uniref:MFS transporter n=1 Tax=Gryllotalpicola kribbensis TaxID=993084 RepID=A0ABP8AQ99_9MICO